MAAYVKWERENNYWVGWARGQVGADQILSINTVKVAGKRVVYLNRKGGAREVCKTIAQAKEYGNELARLWNYQPLTGRRL
jgi:hypothetical protein